jgi:mevalonate kinase
MPAISASAPGKIILVGEHAVVYGQPALAVPVHQVRTRAIVMALPRGKSGDVQIEAPDIGLKSSLQDLQNDQPIAALLYALIDELKISHLPAMMLKITSTIPVAAGLGSGAAVSVAVARVVSEFVGHPISDEQVSRLAYRVEMIHHGNPSGIDNTVITYGAPVYFMRGAPMELLNVPAPFHLLIGHSGIQSATIEVVSDLRSRWQKDPDFYNDIFNQVGQISRRVKELIEHGRIVEMGEWMNKNHSLLQKIDVSCPELDRLVDAACAGNALGAKLSGAGRGGNMIALVREDDIEIVEKGLLSAGATRVIRTKVQVAGNRK